MIEILLERLFDVLENELVTTVDNLPPIQQIIYTKAVKKFGQDPSLVWSYGDVGSSYKIFVLNNGYVLPVLVYHEGTIKSMKVKYTDAMKSGMIRGDISMQEFRYVC